MDFFEEPNISSLQAPPTSHLSQVEFGLPLGSQELRKWSPGANGASPALSSEPTEEAVPETQNPVVVCTAPPPTMLQNTITAGM